MLGWRKNFKNVSKKLQLVGSAKPPAAIGRLHVPMPGAMSPCLEPCPYSPQPHWPWFFLSSQPRGPPSCHPYVVLRLHLPLGGPEKCRIFWPQSPWSRPWNFPRPPASTALSDPPAAPHTESLNLRCLSSSWCFSSGGRLRPRQGSRGRINPASVPAGQWSSSSRALLGFLTKRFREMFYEERFAVQRNKTGRFGCALFYIHQD